MKRFLVAKSSPLLKASPNKEPKQALLKVQEHSENQDQKPKQSENASIDNDTQATRISASLALSNTTTKSTNVAKHIFDEEKPKMVLGEKNLN